MSAQTQNENVLAALSQADSETLKEIIRQSELYLESQLAVGLAVDQRAMTLASILAGSVALIIGGAATLFVAGPKYAYLVLPFVPLVICFMLALWRATEAAKPTEFEYRGNAPDQWVQDVLDKKELALSLAEQAAHYDDAIKFNAKVLRESTKNLSDALKIALIGLGASAVALLFMLFMIMTQQ